jgi:hypothetical protein
VAARRRALIPALALSLGARERTEPLSPGFIDADLFCHRRQTDQLMVLRGALELVVLQAGRLRRITLREDEPTWVRIPPGVRHGASDPRDYQPRPIPAAFIAAGAALLPTCAPTAP